MLARLIVTESVGASHGRALPTVVASNDMVSNNVSNGNVSNDDVRIGIARIDGSNLLQRPASPLVARPNP